MSNSKSSLAILTALMALSAASQAFATNAKTYVSRTGADAGTCPSTLPCATFAYAIGQTTAGGEISVVDSGEYGQVAITKSISIVAEGAEGGVTLLAAGDSGITVNAPGGVVRLRGLTIDGSVAGGTSNGILAYAGSLDVQNCVLRGASFAGINFASPSSASLHVADVLITDSNYGILVFPSGSGVTFADLTRVRTDAAFFGVLADSGNGTSQVQVQVKDSVFAGGGVGVKAHSGSALTVVSVSNSHSVGNQYGMAADGAQSVVILDQTVIQASTTQALGTNNGGVIFSYGNNPINDNAALGTSPIAIGLQ